jgi:hypothetical protein
MSSKANPFRPWTAADAEDALSERRSAVTHARARARASRELVEAHDLQPDLSDAAYQLLVAEGGPLLLALASPDRVVSGQAQGRLRALAHRYQALVRAELKR